MICPPEDGSREETAQVLELVSGLFGQEILGYGYPENGLGGCMSSCLGLTDFSSSGEKLSQRKAGSEPPEGGAMAGVPLAQVQG